MYVRTYVCTYVCMYMFVNVRSFQIFMFLYSCRQMVSPIYLTLQLGQVHLYTTKDLRSFPTSSFSNFFVLVLPIEFKEALLKWNQIEVQQSVQLIPALFQGVEVKSGVKNPQMSLVISSCVSEVVKTHLCINSHGE